MSALLTRPIVPPLYCFLCCVCAWRRSLRRRAIGLLVDSAAHCTQKVLQPSWTQQEARTLFQISHLLARPLPLFRYTPLPYPLTHNPPTLTQSNPQLTKLYLFLLQMQIHLACLQPGLVGLPNEHMVQVFLRCKCPVV